MQRKQVTVGELQFGMFVAELDRPWTETPFMFQGFHLKTEQQLEALKKLCKHVFIDIERTEKADPRPPAAEFKIRGKTKYVEQVKVEVEYQQATQVYSKSIARIDELLKPISQPGGGARGLGTSPATGTRALPVMARSGTASSSMRV